MSKKKAKVSQPTDVNASRNCTSCNQDVNIGLGGEANWKAHTESLEHRKNTSAVQNNRMLTSFFQPKSVSMQSVAVAGPAKAWQPVTGTGEAQIAKLSAAPASKQLPSCNDNVIDIEARELANTSAPCGYGLQLIQDLRNLAKGLAPSIPVGASDELLSRFGGDPRQEVEEDQDPWEMVNQALDNALGYEKTPEDLARCMRRGSLGIDGLCNWLEISIRFLGIQGVLLEPRIEKVIKSLQICGAKAIVPEPVNHIAVKSRGSLVASKRGPENLACQPCSGYKLEIPSGQSPYGCYPFGLHTRYTLPWTCVVHDDAIYLVSKSCQKNVSMNVLDRHGKQHTTCFDCRHLENNEQIMGVRKRMHNGVHENSNHPFFSYFQLVETMKRLKGHNNRGRMFCL
ncbi:uncharacterized protein HD556DRAFT_48100 [Suillus plorans]|uniref:Uncharacterized protein n=1 Tax=Suillus plorans TaxID=116603 RepID=A0A9P7E3P4_9AGAM|nr:uncharacterized protein HD556DRAFT_48100 [Suillus plorans]KAG1810373.1 hypothetical protein HD556DRAFT_48100 [Suillus plorans]